jgi:D-alanine-D-alanine ligase
VLRIGIAYSLKPDDRGEFADGPDDRYEEFDKPETIEALADAIRGDGHDVSLLGDGREFLVKMLADPPDFVFNFAEGQGIGRDREARVPCVCEMLGVPYSGSDPLTMAVALDKGIAASIVSEWGDCEIPASLTFRPDVDESEFRRDLGEIMIEYPEPTLVSKSGSAGTGEPTSTDRLGRPRRLILKPSFEGSSKGIRGRCVTDSLDEAVTIFKRLARDYAQPVRVERFILGDEVTVAVTGEGAHAKVLGAMRILPRKPTEEFVYSLEVKRDWRNMVRYEAPAELPGPVLAELMASALAAHRALGCRDISRLDYRVWEGCPYFIEANPLPGLAPVSSDLVILAEGYGISHGDLVRMILRTALDRVGLGDSGAKTG